MLDLTSPLAAVLGTLLLTIASGAWFVSAQVSALEEHARRLTALEVDHKDAAVVADTVGDRLTRIEALLEFIAAALPGCPAAVAAASRANHANRDPGGHAD